MEDSVTILRPRKEGQCPVTMVAIETSHQLPAAVPPPLQIFRKMSILPTHVSVAKVMIGVPQPGFISVAYPGIFFGGGSTNSVEDKGQRERGPGGGSPLIRGSGGSCNLVQEISFHIVKFS